MRSIIFNEPNDRVWKEWRERCEAATRQLIEAAKTNAKPSDFIDGDLYKEQKVRIYMDYDQPFRGKCAYCDRDIQNQYGDVEHYRPKGRVTDTDGKIVVRRKNGGDEVHPGYYWLAYEWKNLLPSCIRCNRPSSQFTEGKNIGKWDKFPVNGYRAWAHGKETAEDPLILNPTHTNPKDHLIYNRNGTLGWKSEYGEQTVTIIGLNDYGLPDRRKEKYEQVRSVTADYIQTYRADKDCAKTMNLENQIRRIKQGYGDFTMYALMAIEDELKMYEEAIEKATNVN